MHSGNLKFSHGNGYIDSGADPTNTLSTSTKDGSICTKNIDHCYLTTESHNIS